MRYLTIKNAPDLLGKELDCTHRLFHHYPLTVGQWPNGNYYVQDRTGTCMPVPEEIDSFRRYAFNIVDRVILPEDPSERSRKINRMEVISTSAPGRYTVRVREEGNGSWWYVKQYSKGRYQFTRDHTWAKDFSYAVARQHMARIPSDILEH